MTEDTWLSCQTAPMTMFRQVEKSLSQRKCLLIGIVLGRIIAEDLYPKTSKAHDWLSVDQPEVLDRPDQLLELLRQQYQDTFFQFEPDPEPIAEAARFVFWSIMSDQPQGLGRCIGWTTEYFSRKARFQHQSVEQDTIARRICGLMREGVGNPFRVWKRVPVFLAGGMLQPDGKLVQVSSTVHDLAEAIFTQQGFDRMPILADALEESGFTDSEILTHCREAESHSVGCWVLDLLRGSS
jgi:hypothetical protein